MSHHRTYNCDWSKEFKECNGLVNMVDNGMYGIKGSGIVHIEMYVDIVRKLDCWFVLYL